jgi:pyruvate kinase
MKKTKIIGTVGPVTSSKEMIKEMILTGMDVVRINMSHASHDYAEHIVKTVRELNDELGTNIGVLFDIRGPKIRIVNCNFDCIHVEKGSHITLTSEYNQDSNDFLVNYPDLIHDVNPGHRILLDDGLIELKVIEEVGQDVICEVQNSGVIRNNTSVNIPGADLSLDFLSCADKDDIVFASKLNADFIALSFVRSANDVLDVNDMLISLKNEHSQIIAKIETHGAIDDLDNIIKVSDGIMVARGDLGVEIDLEKVPSMQKRIVSKCFEANKICIVATQMLSTMQYKPMPTRAEVSDVANAVIDGADAVMLSGETAIGNYPIETIKMMAKVIKNIEQELDYTGILNAKKTDDNQDVTTVIAHNVVDSANRLKANAIMVSTISGYTARKVSNFRPGCPIFAITPSSDIGTSLSLNWGVVPIRSKMFDSTDEIVEYAIATYREKMAAEKGKIIITGGFPMNAERNTNFMKVEDIKE